LKRIITGMAIISFLVLGAGYPSHPWPLAAYAEDDWKAEFAEVCGWTTDSMSLSKDELKALIERCDRLKPRIEKQDESTAKVYLKRLQMCRDLFAYVLESKSQ